MTFERAVVAELCRGLAAFRKRYPGAAPWIVGDTGVPLEEFFARPAEHWFS